MRPKKVRFELLVERLEVARFIEDSKYFRPSFEFSVGGFETVRIHPRSAGEWFEAGVIDFGGSGKSCEIPSSPPHTECCGTETHESQIKMTVILETAEGKEKRVAHGIFLADKIYTACKQTIEDPKFQRLELEIDPGVDVVIHVRWRFSQSALPGVVHPPPPQKHRYPQPCQATAQTQLKALKVHSPRKRTNFLITQGSRLSPKAAKTSFAALEKKEPRDMPPDDSKAPMESESAISSGRSRVVTGGLRTRPFAITAREIFRIKIYIVWSWKKGTFWVLTRYL